MAILDSIQDFLEPRPLFFEVLLWTSLLLLTLIVLALAYLTLARILYLSDERRKARVAAEWAPVFRAIRENMPYPLMSLQRWQAPYFLELWLDQVRLAPPDVRRELLRLGVKVHLDRAVVKLLRPGIRILPRIVWLQSLALEAGAYFDKPTVRRRISDMSETDNEFLAVQACASLVRMRARGYQRAIVSVLFRFPHEAPHIISRIAHAGGAEVLHILEPFLDKLPASTLLNFIGLAEQSRDASLLPVLLRRLDATNSYREAAAILKSLARLGSVEQREDVLPFLKLPNLPVRIQAAKAMGTVGTPEDLPVLLPLLRGQDWWERYRAAQAIIELVDNDREEIENLIAAQDDQFARDILIHAHEERDWCLT